MKSCSVATHLFLNLFIATAFLLLLPKSANAQEPSSNIVINEVIIDSRGPSNREREYIELFSTEPVTSLEGLSIIVVEGVDVPASQIAKGDVIRRWDFPTGARTNQNGFYLLANQLTEEGYKVRADMRFGYEDRLTNEPTTFVLLQTRFAPALGQNVKKLQIPSQAILDAVALTGNDSDTEFFFNAPVLGPDQRFLAAGALRTRDGINTGDISDWALADIETPPDPTYNSPGAPNAVGNSAVIIDAENIQANAELTTAPPQWNVYDPAAVENAIRQHGSALVYIRSKRYEFCFQYENNYLLHPVAQPLLSNRPLYYMDVTDAGYGRLASELGIYRIPAMAFKKRGGSWEYLVITPRTTGQEIYEYLQKR